MCGIVACCASACCCPCIAQGALNREAKSWDSGLGSIRPSSPEAQAITMEIRAKVADIADRLQTACTNYVESQEKLSDRKVEQIELKVDAVIRVLLAYQRAFETSIAPIKLGIAETKKSQSGQLVLKRSRPVGALQEIVKTVPELQVELKQHGKHTSAVLLVSWEQLTLLQQAAVQKSSDSQDL